MKTIILVIAVLFVCSSALAGDINFPLLCSQKVNLGGVERAILCTGAKSRAPIDCFAKAKLELRDRDAAIACSGATSMAPYNCMIKNKRLLVTDEAVLCSGATSNAPAICAEKTKLLGSDAAVLCTENGLIWTKYLGGGH